MNSHTFPEARSVKSSWWDRPSPESPGSSRLSMACGPITPIFAFFVNNIPLCVFLSESLLFSPGQESYWIRDHSKDLNSNTSAKIPLPSPPRQSHMHKYWGLELAHIIFGDTIHPILVLQIWKFEKHNVKQEGNSCLGHLICLISNF